MNLRRSVPILDYIRALLAEKDLRDQQRYDAQTKAVETAMAAQQTAMRAALDAADKLNATIITNQKEAVAKAEIAAEKRFDLLNELRMGVATQEQFQALEKLVAKLAEEVAAAQASVSGGATTRSTFFAIGGLIIAGASVVILLIAHLVQ